ncbi:MAG: FAD-dependent oxidoreductase [Candidatus Hatepunaea meridiana]|nr:FAD-dependent oxidoreductase [Candidatus Hatepunaea meridiana]
MNTDLLVIGGGIAGITAAVEAAEVGKKVVLVEKEHWLGGRVVQMHKYFPKLCPPMCGLEINFRRIRQNPDVTVLTGASPTKIEGDADAFKATINVEPRYVKGNYSELQECAKECPVEVTDNFNFGMRKVKALRVVNELAYPFGFFVEKEAINDPAMKEFAAKYDCIDLDMKAETVEIDAKAIIWATGWEPYDATKIDNLGYGKLPNVVTNMNMERMASAGGPTKGKIVRPSDSKPITKAAFVQCAGSRDENHLPYCSAICCMASLKQNRYIREQYPDAELHIFFIDARTPGRWEDFLQEVEGDEKTIIHRGKVAKIEEAEDGMVILTAENTLTGMLEHVTVDLAILATGMVPTVDTTLISGIKRTEYGFIENNNGSAIISAGVAAAPKDVATSNEEATGAVIKALQIIGRS